MFCSTLASRGLTNNSYSPHTYIYMSDRWGERNGTGYWMVGPVDDLSDRVFIEENTLDMDQMISEYNTTSTTQFGKMMREFCLKKIYPGLTFNGMSLIIIVRHSGLSTSDDVTCISLKRRLLLCGTNNGALLVFAADKEDPLSKSRHSNLDCEVRPLAKMKISTEPIVKVEVNLVSDVSCTNKQLLDRVCQFRDSALLQNLH